MQTRCTPPPLAGGGWGEGAQPHPFPSPSGIHSMTALWTARDLMEATGGAMETPFAATGVSIDTRTIQPGDLFVALQGETADGHRFVTDALAKGAAGALVHRDVPDAGHLLLVDDTLAGLHRLGGYARERSTARLVAVTGSVGKTTTKEMLRTILAAFGRTHAAVASYNNHWGLPLTLARMPPDTEFCVAEIGMNHAGEIAPLARLARPHVAVITAVEKAHIGYLGSIEAIADEKAETLRALEPGGVAVLPADSPLLPRLRAAAGGARVVTFGAAPTADVRLVDLAMDADGSDVVAEVEGERIAFRLNASGRHMAMNALAALAAARHLTHGTAAESGSCAGRLRAGGRPWRAPADHAAGRHRAADRRKLQRQPRLDARGARGAPPAARAATHCRARRYAGTRRRQAPTNIAPSPPMSPPPPIACSPAAR